MPNIEQVPQEQEVPQGAVEQQAPEQGPVQATEIGGDNSQMGRESQAYISGLMKMLHSKETSSQIVEMLKSGKPEEVIPQVALTVNKQMEDAVSSQGQKPSLEVLLSAGVYLVNDLVEIGNAAGAFDLTDAEQVAPILKETMQTYIQAGLKDGSIDPVELQKAVEPMMSEEHRAAGLEGAAAAGIPEEPNDMVAMEQYASGRERQGMMKGGK